MNGAHSVLIEATRKLMALVDHPDSDWVRGWGDQLPARCPPVLWFGNAGSKKRKVLTLGANPSRKEFLLHSAAEATERVRSSGDQTRLCYLEPPYNRLWLLPRGQKLTEILESKDTRNRIIESYNAYFANRPYEAWFGHNHEDSYKVEGFLRGIGASYYDDNPAYLQAIHIDLFPFVTIEDFTSIREMVVATLFDDGWAKQFLMQLISVLSPEVIVIFGRTNCRYFAKYMDPSVHSAEWEWFSPGKYFVTRSSEFSLPVVCLSTNLGNPRGFDAKGLRQFGRRLQPMVFK